MFLWLVLAVLAHLLSITNGFAPQPSTVLFNPSTRIRPSSLSDTSTTSTLNALPDYATGDIEAARGFFYIWFFGGSGGVGVALRQFPQQYANFKKLSAMSDDGPTLGGPTVGISPFCLYPRDLSKADIDKVLRNKLTVEEMVKKGPKPNYLSEKGYLCYPSFLDANKGCNPLTVRAIFDALSTGDNVSPDVAQVKLDKIKQDMSDDRSVFKSELLKTKFVGFSSIAFLLFLLGPIVGATCLESLAAGWFPEWPGNGYLPWSLLFGPGFWTIPNYWV
mmetsp:Transcript_24859/g.49522  ORF Transcript_24859/g.49522 Transcript_24859/m.49522 type:complete len:276 (-) Transcript_24859:171-998(-)